MPKRDITLCNPVIPSGPSLKLMDRNPRRFCLGIGLNLTAQFIRPILVGDWLTITAKVVSRGNQILYMTAEAFNEKNKLIATGSANAMMLKSVPKASS